MTKSDLRKIYLKKQQSLSGVERNERSGRVADQFFENFDTAGIKFLHIFLPIEKNKEIETSFIFKRLWAEFPNVATAAPRVNFEMMTLENFRFNSETELAENKWNISEPTGGELVESARVDAVLVPLLCFDERGFRVGYGGGFYDKFLSECRTDCLKIGLSYFSPVAEISDARDFDVKLDFCVTPQTVVKF